MSTLNAVALVSVAASQNPSAAPSPAELDVLPLLAALTLGLLLVALLHAGAALLFRRRAAAKDERFARLTAQWNPALFAFLFDGRTVEEVQELVAPEDRLLFVNALLQYSRRLSGEDMERIQTLAAPFLAVVSERLHRRSPGVRARAVQTLGELGWRTYVAEIIAALDDPSPLVSIVAARSLCHPESVDYVPEVLRRLSRFRSWTPTFLASMLATAGALAAHALRETLWDDDGDERSRAIAAEALRQLSDFRAAGAAEHVLGQSEERNLVVAALRLLGDVGQERHLGSILNRVEDDDFVVRVAAVDAMAALGGHAELRHLQELVHHDPSRWVALHAARGLMNAGQLAPLRTLANGDHARAAIGAQVLAEAGRR